MKRINDFLNELSRADWESPLFNGIDLRKGGCGLYEEFVEELYQGAVSAMFEVSDVNKRILNLRYNDLLGKVCEFYEIAKGGKDFEESAKNANDPNIKDRFELLFQMTQCLEVKFKYIQMFEKYIVDPPLMSGIEDVVEELKVADKQESENPQPQNNDSKTVKGIKGLAKHLGCGINKAQEISNSGILRKEGIQYSLGRDWFFNIEKLDIFLSKNPQALDTIRRKNGTRNGTKN